MKVSKALVDATLKTGLPPIDMMFFPCNDKEGQCRGYYAMLILNTVEFGILTPSEFRIVAGRTNQAHRLGEKAIDKAILELRRKMSTAKEYDYMMLELPRQMLDNDALTSILEERFSTSDFSVREKLCILFGSEILLTDPEITLPKLKKLTALGVHIGITDFGDESTSTLRLAHFPFEVVVLDPSVQKLIKDGKDAALSATVAFANALGLKVILNGTLTDAQREKAFAAGVSAVLDTDIRRAQSGKEEVTDG